MGQIEEEGSTAQSPDCRLRSQRRQQKDRRLKGKVGTKK